MKNNRHGARLGVLSLACAACFCAPVHSASLSEVVVLGSRFADSPIDVPAAVQVISAEQIRESGALSLPETLMMLAGAHVRSSVGGQLGVGAVLDLGGFGATATQNNLVLLDGRRLNPIDGSEIDWGGIPLASVQRIEVSYASGAVQYGAGASAGVVNIVTNASQQERQQLQFSVGSFGTQSGALSLDRRLQGGFLHLAGEASHSDGWRDNGRSDASGLVAKYSLDIGATASAFVEISASQQSNGFSGGVVAVAGDGNQQAAKFNNVGSLNDVSKNALRLGGSVELTPASVLEADLVYGSKASRYVQPYYDSADSFGPAYLPWLGYVTGAGLSRLDGNEFSVSPRLRTSLGSDSSLVLGIDYAQARQSGSNEYGAQAQQFILANQMDPAHPEYGGYLGNVLSDRQSVQLGSQSAYALARFGLRPALELSLGLRRQLQNYDSTDLNKSSGISQTASGTYAATAYQAALNYKLDAQSHVFLRLDQSYRFANTDEYWGFDANMNRVFSGELRPQLTQGYSLGYAGSVGAQQLALAFGQSLTEDEIRYNPALYRNSNLDDKVLRSSLQLNWSASFGESTRVSAGARLQRAVFLTGSYSGQGVPQVPDAIYSLGWLQRLDAQTRLSLQLLHVASQIYESAPSNVPNLQLMPAYNAADLSLSRSYGRLEARLSVKNLLGGTYASYGGYGFVSQPGASGANSYYYYPSDPRSVFLSLNYQL